MCCDYYIFTYLKLYTSNGVFDTHIETLRGWYTSLNYKKQLDSHNREYLIYKDNEYINNNFHDYAVEYGNIVTNLVKKVNDKISKNKKINSDDIYDYDSENDENSDKLKLIDFNDIIKITIASRAYERL